MVKELIYHLGLLSFQRPIKNIRSGGRTKDVDRCKSEERGECRNLPLSREKIRLSFFHTTTGEGKVNPISFTSISAVETVRGPRPPRPAGRKRKDPLSPRVKKKRPRISSHPKKERG